MKNLTASVAICNPDPDIFNNFLISLMLHTPELAHLIIVDNASASKDHIQRAQKIIAYSDVKVTVIHYEENVGFGRAHNRALKDVRTKYFAVLNDDIEFFEAWAGPMIEILEDNPQVAQVGPKREVCNGLTEQGKGYWQDTDAPEYCEGSCFIVRAALVRQNGLFDERYQYAYFEDTDLSLRLRRDGHLIKNVDIKWKHHRAVTSQKVDIDLKGYHIANEFKFRQRWSSYLSGKRFSRTIVIKRSASLGDVFLTTPVIEALKLKYPYSVILMMTDCPQTLHGHNDIDFFVPMNSPVFCDEFIDLDYSYEKDFTRHIVDAYAGIAGVKVQRKTGILFILPEDKDLVNALIPEDFGKFAVIDYSDTWGGKGWDKERYNELTALIRKDGYKIIGVGVGNKLGANYAPDINLVNALTPLQTGYLIYKSNIFIGHEGLLAHMAQASKTPAVVLYGCTTPELVNTMTSILKPVITPAACRGCRHRYAAGVGIFCSREFECMKMITVERVYEEFKSLTEAGKLESVEAGK